MNNDGFDRIADLPKNGAREKETYARFGLAAYQAQVFEAGIVNLITTLSAYQSRVGRPFTTADIDALNADLFSQTAGRLVRKLRLVLGDDPHIDACKFAVRERNRLIHNFFRDHDRDFMTADGMQRMLDDADEIRRLLTQADAVSAEMTRAIFAKLGVGPEQIQAEFDALLTDAQSADVEDDPRN